MFNNKQKCTFGPVPSRRLGRSLGIDIVPFKTCTYDCIYCQLGRTVEKTVSRTEFISVDKVLDDVLERKQQQDKMYYTIKEDTIFFRSQT